MFLKGYNKCKYNLFKEYWERKSSSWNVDEFILEFEEEERLERELREVEATAKAEEATKAAKVSTTVTLEVLLQAVDKGTSDAVWIFIFIWSFELFLSDVTSELIF